MSTLDGLQMRMRYQDLFGEDMMILVDFEIFLKVIMGRNLEWFF